MSKQSIPCPECCGARLNRSPGSIFIGGPAGGGHFEKCDHCNGTGVVDRPKPKPGDVLLGCIHKPDRNHAHYYLLGGDGMPFTRPDRTTAVARWIVLCEMCYRETLQTEKSPAEMPIAFDYTWTDADEVDFKEMS